MRAAENASTPVGLGMAGERPDADEKVDRLKVEPDGRPGKVAHSDATPDGGEEQPYEEPAWRAGRKLGRSIYYHEQYRGMLESPGLAARVVDLLNQDERRIASASPT